MSKNTPIQAPFAGDHESYQYLEVKKLAEILGRHKLKVLDNLRACRRLKRDIAWEKDPVARLYMSYKSAYIRCHLRDAFALYRRVYHDYHVACTRYMAGISEKSQLWAPHNAILHTPMYAAMQSSGGDEAA